MSTTVTIELTDEMVTALRTWQREPIPPGVSSFHIPTVVATLVANELPPPPVKLIIELPADVSHEHFQRRGTYLNGAPGALDHLEPTEAKVLNAVYAALRQREISV